VSVVQASPSLQRAATSDDVNAMVPHPVLGLQVGLKQMSVDLHAADKSVGTHEPAVPAPLVHLYVVHSVSAGHLLAMGAS